MAHKLSSARSDWQAGLSGTLNQISPCPFSRAHVVSESWTFYRTGQGSRLFQEIGKGSVKGKCHVLKVLAQKLAHFILWVYYSIGQSRLPSAEGQILTATSSWHVHRRIFSHNTATNYVHSSLVQNIQTLSQNSENSHPIMASGLDLSFRVQSSKIGSGCRRGGSSRYFPGEVLEIRQ